MPIILSHERNLALALWTTVIPTTGLVLGYCFILKPQRRQARAEYVSASHRTESLKTAKYLSACIGRFFRKARRQLREEKADIIREVKETTALLQDTAKRHVRAETACDGVFLFMSDL